jgi:hypothetical protein
MRKILWLWLMAIYLPLTLIMNSQTPGGGPFFSVKISIQDILDLLSFARYFNFLVSLFVLFLLKPPLSQKICELLIEEYRMLVRIHNDDHRRLLLDGHFSDFSSKSSLDMF